MSEPGLDRDFYFDAIYKLIKMTSTVLPEDVHNALKTAKKNEEGVAESTLDIILKNVDMAAKQGTPICQDTGFPSFYFNVPGGMHHTDIAEWTKEAVAQSVTDAVLRPNAVDSITGKNPGTCVGAGIPYLNFQEWDKDYIEVKLILKGGGSENVSAQYSVPYAPLGAGRDLQGVEKVVLDTIFKAQGKGCCPGIVGVCIGSDRANGFASAKKALFRKLDESNSDPELAALEKRIIEKSNQLSIGPMGFGGKTTLLGAKVVAQHRHPASFFVSIAYNCWAYRRHTMVIKGGEASYD